MSSDQQSETSSDSIYDVDSPQETLSSPNTHTSIAQEHVMESDIEESSNRKRRRQQPDHSHGGRERPSSSEMIKLLKELTNCDKTDKVEIMDAVVDYIKALESQLQMIKATTNWPDNIGMEMFYGMEWPEGMVFPAPPFDMNPVLAVTSALVVASEPGPSMSSESSVTSQDQAKTSS